MSKSRPLLAYVREYLTREPTAYDSNAGVARLRKYIHDQTGIKVRRSDLTDLGVAQGLTTNSFDYTGRRKP